MLYFYITAAFILIMIFCYYQNNKLDVSEHTINSKYDDEFKIAHLSDYHSKPFKAILKKLNDIKPDIICITGDYINDHCKNKERMLEYAKSLVEIAPVYYITGNHERRLECFDELMQELKAIGFTVLLNDLAENEHCTILGLDENQADFDDYKARREGTFVYKSMNEYFEKLSQSDKFKLVLCHFPENFRQIKELDYSQYDFDLQLSGHAHGGQWIIFKPLFSPGQGVFPKYARGTFGDRPKLIISRGIGNSEFPLRLFNHPELIIVNIKNRSTEN